MKKQKEKEFLLESEVALLFGTKAKCRIIDCLSDGKKKYEAEIAKETNLSTTAISNTLDILIDNGFVYTEKVGWINLFWVNKKEIKYSLELFFSNYLEVVLVKKK